MNCVCVVRCVEARARGDANGCYTDAYTQTVVLSYTQTKQQRQLTDFIFLQQSLNLERNKSKLCVHKKSSHRYGDYFSNFVSNSGTDTGQQTESTDCTPTCIVCVRMFSLSQRTACLHILPLPLLSRRLEYFNVFRILEGLQAVVNYTLQAYNLFYFFPFTQPFQSVRYFLYKFDDRLDF